MEAARRPVQADGGAALQERPQDPERRDGVGDHRRGRGTGDAELWHAGPAEGQGAAQRDLQHRGHDQRQAGDCMSPVPRRIEASVLASQCAPQPRNITQAKAIAPSSAAPLPPIAA